MENTKETSDSGPKSTSPALSDQGKSLMQGNPEKPAPPENLNQDFTDKKGHDMAIRAYPNEDSCMIRANDKQKTPDIPESARYSDAGMANVHLEKEIVEKPDGSLEKQVSRARLNDIDIPTEEYKGTGIGSKMLESAEKFSKDSGAKELYGKFAPDEGESQFLQGWYENHGYKMREGPFGKEVFKTFPAE